MSIIIIYHDTENYENYKELEEDIKNNLNNAILIPISEIDKIKLNHDDKVISLIPLRGGHNKSIEQISKKYNIILYKLPIELILKGIISNLRSNKCDELCIVYWKAKRLVNEQEEDLNYLIENIKNNLKISNVSLDCNKCYKCVIALTMLKGKLSENALKMKEKCNSFVIEDLYSISKSDIINWIKNVSRQQ
ncbi:MAG: hypothetical protein ACP5I6_00965 [Caldisphaera sp.]|nr:MAG: hypothetical protein C0201_00635 [Caldisphaera sp.]PMP88586.1 MAG: hypothetical protein C0172_02275 [Caldisphaera sp.]